MIDTGFFKWVWRFNALLIAAVATVILGMLTWELTRDLRTQTFPRATTDTLVVSPTDTPEPLGSEPQQTLRLGNALPNNTPGTYALPLYAEQTYTNRGISKDSRGNLLNYLIVGTDPQAHHWLFPKGERLIIETRPLVFHQSNAAQTRLGQLLEVIEADTSGDATLSRQDTRTLYLISPEWDTPVQFISGVSSVLAVQPVGPTSFDLIVMVAGTAQALRVSAPAARVMSRQTLDSSD
ncbi:hypothetical protein [uncultured Sulfitobacter sp.]|uniref:hypothetical protein n=1 Tax=uncultured Sulfitobacter sp. TaxID=191468 RepID=UPI002629E7B5|nr:hypothetical protein [uncultured Sulfitobacter sp.]